MDETDILYGLFIAVLTLGGTAVISALITPSSRYYRLLVFGGGASMLVAVVGIAFMLISSSRTAPAGSGPTITGSGTTVVSVGQTGGVTAGTYVNQAIMPEFHILSKSDSQNQDGSTTTAINTEVVAPVTPGNLHINIGASGLEDVQIMPPPQNGVSSMEMRNVARSGTSFSADIPSPNGQYEITIRTDRKTPINLDSHF